MFERVIALNFVRVRSVMFNWNVGFAIVIEETLPFAGRIFHIRMFFSFGFATVLLIGDILHFVFRKVL